MRVGLIGTGHVGVPTAAGLASLGHQVVATDIDGSAIRRLRDGIVPFFEPGLDELVLAGLRSGSLRFTTDASEAIAGAEVVFLCVGTPARENGDANLLAVERSAATVAEHATRDVVIVEKSTVPAGTAARVAETVSRRNGGVRFWLVSNPEFLREGSAVEDTLHPNRVLIGADAPEAFAAMRRLYEPLRGDDVSWIETDIATAELAKHACNAFLATKISFVNALARLCEAAGADVVRVADVMGGDPRIGASFLNAGIGFGGYCLPKDLAALEQLAARHGYGFGLLREAAQINDEALGAAFDKVQDALWHLEGKRIALLGLAFKPGTDDVRFAPALALARRFHASGAAVVGYDPFAAEPAQREFPDLILATDPLAALTNADAAVLCTEWDELVLLDPRRLARAMTTPIIVDGRNALDGDAYVAAGFTYLPMGRPERSPEARLVIRLAGEQPAAG